MVFPIFAPLQITTCSTFSSLIDSLRTTSGWCLLSILPSMKLISRAEEIFFCWSSKSICFVLHQIRRFWSCSTYKCTKPCCTYYVDLKLRTEVNGKPGQNMIFQWDRGSLEIRKHWASANADHQWNMCHIVMTCEHSENFTFFIFFLHLHQELELDSWVDSASFLLLKETKDDFFFPLFVTIMIIK